MWAALAPFSVRCVTCTTWRVEVSRSLVSSGSGTPFDPGAADTDPRIGLVLDGRYRVEQRLGSGGMGVVYRSLDLQGAPEAAPVAVKFLHDSFAAIPDLVKRFDREVQAMRRLSHPHLVAIVGAGLSNRVPYLVMELLAGRALGDVLDQGALEPARAVNVAQQILAGVAHAHESGVVHRDLKPDNILLDGDFVKILDFGLAKMAQESATQLTTSGLALGTPSYMSPEQARGVTADTRADLYSIGVMLYHMVVGKKPFVADSPMAVLRMHLDDPPRPPRQAAPGAVISAALEATILRALEKDPSERWQTADAFARALAATPEGGGSLDDEAFDATMLGHVRSPSSPPSPSSPSLASLASLAKAAVAGAPPPPGDETKPGSRSGGSRVRRARLFAPRRRGGLVAWVVVLAVAGGGVAWGWPTIGPIVQRQVSAARKLIASYTAPAPAPPGRAVATPEAAATPSIARPSAPRDAVVTPPSPPTGPSALSKIDEEELAEDDPSDDPTSPGARLEATAPTPPARPVTLAEAGKLIDRGQVDEAIAALFALRKKKRSAPVALLLGHAYFKKGWRSDGLREYKVAIAMAPSLRRNPTMIKNAVAGMEGSTYRSANWLLRKRVGPSAVGELRRAARSDKDPTVRRRTAKLAADLSRRGSGKRRRR